MKHFKPVAPAAFSAFLVLLLASCEPKPVKTGLQNTPPETSPSNGLAHASPQLRDTGISSFVLPNGIRLLVQEDHTAPVASVQAWCAAGSITEGDHLGAGLSHILEHMLFKGTKTRGNSEIAQQVQSVGGYINAYTSFDRTVFYIDLPSAGWEKALEILSDAMFNSTLPVEEFAKEQEVIRREFAMGFDDPERVIQKLLFSTAFTTHPYRFPVIGNLETYNLLTREDILEYYHEQYVPDNMTFVITGDVDPQVVYSKLAAFTADVPRRSLPDAYIPQEPKQLGLRERHEVFPSDVTRVALAWHIPAITHPDLYGLDIMAGVAGGGTSSRLHRELVERRKLFRNIGVYSYTPAQTGLWVVSGTLMPDSGLTPRQAADAVLELMEAFKAKPVTEQELARAKRQAIVDRAQEMKTVAGKASSLGSSWFVAKDLNFSDTYLDKLGEVTQADVQRVAKTYFDASNLTIVSLAPGSAEAATAATSEAKGGDLKNGALPNGIRYVTCHDTKVPLVTLRAVLKGGLLAESAAENGVGKLATRLLDKGTASRSAEEIANEIEDLGGSLSTEFGNNSFSVAVEVLETDLDKAVELLSDVLLHPEFPEDEIAKEKAKQLTDLKVEKDEPMVLARDAMRATLFGSSPYSLNPLGTPENLAKIDRKALKAYHARLVSPANLVLMAGGSFDPGQLAKLWEKHFPASAFPQSSGDWQPQPSSFHGTGQVVSVATSKAQAIVQIGYPGVDVASPDRAALEVMDEALSDLASRLFIRIREKQSLAYFVGTGQLVGLNRGSFIFYAGTRPDAAEKVRTELLDEISLIVKDGLAPAEVERAKAKLLGQRLLQDQAASIIAYKAALNLLYGLGMDYEARFNAEIQAMTPEKVLETARKYFSMQDYVCVMVQPEAGKPAAPAKTE